MNRSDRKGLLKISLLFCGVLCFPFIWTSCDTDKYFETPPNLPAITCEGKKTFGCFINGKAFGPQGLNAAIESVNPHTGHFELRMKNDHSGEMIWIVIKDQVHDTGRYKLGFLGYSKGYCRYSNTSAQLREYYCDLNMYGEMHITGLDTIKGIVCGTFSFDTVDEKHPLDTVRIRDGRFDWKFNY